MFERLRVAWTKVRPWVVNGAIVMLLALIFTDQLPFMPAMLKQLVQPVVQGMGIDHGPWKLFAPEPDKANTRFSAEIEYADGTLANWQSPEWRRLSYSRRFLDFRNLEYLDSMSGLLTDEQYLATRAGQALREEFAAYVARVHEGPHPAARLRRVTLWIETATIDNPHKSGWQRLADGVPYGEKVLLHEARYP